MQTRKKTKEDRRFLIYQVGAYVSWIAAFGLTTYLTVVRLGRELTEPPTRFEQLSGIFIILAMGVAIALGSALSRMKLARTITKVFQAGMALGRYQDHDGTIRKQGQDDA